jgi:hypothetical protein
MVSIKVIFSVVRTISDFGIGNYVVLQLQVTHVDSIAMAEAWAGIESSDENEESRCYICLQWLLEAMGVKAQKKLESDICK